MLSLVLKEGEYLTIGENIVVQAFPDSKSRVRLSITAPKDVTILRGGLREKSGAGRPDCVLETRRRPRSEFSWDRNKTQTLIAMRRLLSQMDGRDGKVRDLRRQLDFLFPPEFASNETIYAP